MGEGGLEGKNTGREENIEMIEVEREKYEGIRKRED